MAIKRYAGDRFAGLSTDSKPSNVEDGALFVETDTKVIFVFDGGSWVTLTAELLWGSIGGNLEDQVDLKLALEDAKKVYYGDTPPTESDVIWVNPNEEIDEFDEITYLQAENNLNDLDNIEEARTNLGLGSLSTINKNNSNNHILAGTGNWISAIDCGGA